MSDDARIEERLGEIRARIDEMRLWGFVATCRAEVDLYQLGMVDVAYLLSEIERLRSVIEENRRDYQRAFYNLGNQITAARAERDALAERLAATEGTT